MLRESQPNLKLAGGHRPRHSTCTQYSRDAQRNCDSCEPGSLKQLNMTVAAAAVAMEDGIRYFGNNTVANEMKKENAEILFPGSVALSLFIENTTFFYDARSVHGFEKENKK